MVEKVVVFLLPYFPQKQFHNELGHIRRLFHRFRELFWDKDWVLTTRGSLHYRPFVSFESVRIQTQN